MKFKKNSVLSLGCDNLSFVPTAIWLLFIILTFADTRICVNAICIKLCWIKHRSSKLEEYISVFGTYHYTNLRHKKYFSQYLFLNLASST